MPFYLSAVYPVHPLRYSAIEKRPHVIRNDQVNALSTSPVQPNQSAFIINDGETVFNEAPLTNEIVEIAGRRWCIIEAQSEIAALAAIAHARVSGAIGHKDTLNKSYVGGTIETIAHVMQINSDGTFRRAYTEPY